MSIKILALDMDGTILNHYSTISSEVQKAIRNAMDQGVRVLFATGRNHSHMLPFYKVVGFDKLDTLQISNNGTTIASPQGNVFHLFQPVRTDYIELINRLEARKLGFAVATDLETYTSEHSKNTDDYGDLQTHPNLRELEKATRVVLRTHRGIVEELVDQLSFEYANSIEDYFDIWPIGVDKGTALQKVAAHYQCTMDEVMAIGDSDNDIGMLKVAGLSVAMGQGSSLAKETAQILAPTIDDDGAAWAIEKYILNQAK